MSLYSVMKSFTTCDSNSYSLPKRLALENENLRLAEEGGQDRERTTNVRFRVECTWRCIVDFRAVLSLGWSTFEAQLQLSLQHVVKEEQTENPIEENRERLNLLAKKLLNYCDSDRIFRAAGSLNIGSWKSKFVARLRWAYQLTPARSLRR